MKPEINTRLVRSVVAALVAGLCALASSTASVGAQDIGTLESRIASARSDAQGLAADIEAKTAALTEARSQAAAAAQREAELAGVLARGRERAAMLAERVSEAEARLAETRERLRAAVVVLEERLVAIYKSETPDATTLLLDSDGYEDLITRADYLRQIEDADANLVARVRMLREQVERELAAVREARARQEAFNERVEAAHAQIAAARADAEA
jgi:peptidoglycan hydrolase CwlO-like protein